jgi:UDP-N-acetylmuramoyl-tripeptide--D-alanyl-D-alanine ligase
MGANKFKDIEELCLITEPTHGIITNIGKAHLQGFGSFEGVLQTKKELYTSIELTKGTIVFNQDDEVLRNNLPNTIETIGFSEHQNTIVSGEIVETNPFLNLTIAINNQKSSPLKTHLVGKYNFYNFLAAATFGYLFKVPFEKICNAIENYVPTNNRSQVQKTATNTLIVDCYNANPSSMKLALDSFSEMVSENKIAILGDMFELGDDSNTEHQRIIDQLKELKLNYLLVGQLFHQLTSEHCFATKEALIQHLKSNPLKHQLILLKGSRGIGLEALIEHL